jgi:predicted nucleotidyltransferase
VTVGLDTRADAAAGARTVTQRFWSQRGAVLEIVARHAASDFHVLGTVTRRSVVGATSDIGLVVAVAPDQELTTLAELADEVSVTCGLRVDVVTLEELGAERGRSPRARRNPASPRLEP